MQNIHNVGYLFPAFFDDTVDHFRAFMDAHQPQDLTESDKPGVSFRKGLYLSDQNEADGRFKVLRCSTNLSGPTERLSPHDRTILAKVNAAARELYSHHQQPPELNHVLAQVYHNLRTADNREHRARISRHSDKTKDMPANGLICFCTFYDRASIDDKKLRRVGHDLVYKKGSGGTSALSVLRFTRKEGAEEEGLPAQFDVPLYPNSAFFIDLETNRLFQHETVPPNLALEDTPVRLGYVVRCSNQDAKFMDGRVHLLRCGGGERSKEDDKEEKWVPLEPPTADGVKQLKDLYRQENLSIERVEYPFIPFSLNQGDYLDIIAPFCSSELSANDYSLSECDRKK